MTRAAWGAVGLAATLTFWLAGCGGPDPLIAEPTQSQTPAQAPFRESAAQRVLQPAGGVLDPSGTWRRDVSADPTAPSSDAMVETLVRSLEETGGHTAFNVFQYGVAWYSVAEDQPTTTVRFDNCQDKPDVPEELFDGHGHFVDVPIPDNAVPSVGTDSTLSIYRASTDTLWDLWKVHRQDGEWAACWGGRIDDVSTTDGAFAFPYGASATGLAYGAGAVSINDVRAGRIEHAVSLLLPPQALSNTFVWPATRTDGAVGGTAAIPEGSRLRLASDVDLDALDLTPVGRMVAEAAQRYGFIVTDRAANVAIPAESGAAVKGIAGFDPWRRILQGTPPYLVLKGFPWERVEVLAPERAGGS